MFGKIIKIYTAMITNDEEYITNRCEYIVRREKGKILEPYYTKDDISYVTFTCNPIKYRKIRSAFKDVAKTLSGNTSISLCVTDVFYV